MYNKGMAKKSAQHVRRPYGENLTRAVRVRLPVELDSALRQVRRLFGISAAHQIRTGIEYSLADMIPKVVGQLRHPGTSNPMKLKLIDFLRATRKASLALHEPKMAKALRDGAREETRELLRDAALRRHRRGKSIG